MNQPGSKSWLYDAAKEMDIATWEEPVLIVAPHQDDESLGCGGAIALARKLNMDVRVVFVSDGSMSHPNSKKFSTQRLIDLRESESGKALEILGVANENIQFMRLKDSQVPHANEPAFSEAVAGMLSYFNTVQPKTVLVPWRRDPHPDHQASWQIVHAALQEFATTVQTIEYLIWLWERGDATAIPQPGEVQLVKLDISAVRQQKEAAILAHQSQTTRLIDDDPDGFILSHEVLAHFHTRFELFAVAL